MSYDQIVRWEDEDWKISQFYAVSQNAYLVHPTAGWGQSIFRSRTVPIKDLIISNPALRFIFDNSYMLTTVVPYAISVGMEDTPEEVDADKRFVDSLISDYELPQNAADSFSPKPPITSTDNRCSNSKVLAEIFNSMDKETKDNGTRQKYESGFVREDNGDKLRVDLIPIDMIRRMAQKFTDGGKKYGERNWEKANVQNKEEMDRFKAAAFRHLLAWMNDEFDEDHAAALAVNICMYEDIMLKYKNGLSTE